MDNDKVDEWQTYLTSLDYITAVKKHLCKVTTAGLTEKIHFKSVDDENNFDIW